MSQQPTLAPAAVRDFAEVAAEDARWRAQELKRLQARDTAADAFCLRRFASRDKELLQKHFASCFGEGQAEAAMARFQTKCSPLLSLSDDQLAERLERVVTSLDAPHLRCSGILDRLETPPGNPKALHGLMTLLQHASAVPPPSHSTLAPPSHSTSEQPSGTD
eukprot:g62056.t1